jgi:hypothetical protein
MWGMGETSSEGLIQGNSWATFGKPAYLRRMESAPMPIMILALLFVCVVLLVGSFLILFVFPRIGQAKKLPTWAPQAASAVFMLSLPVVLLLLTMLIFPCFWQRCGS